MLSADAAPNAQHSLIPKVCAPRSDLESRSVSSWGIADRWLQPGGHCDGNPDPLAVAMVEVQEETGLTSALPVTNAIFDVDVHQIPAKGEVPEHWHYDIRYLLVTSDREPLRRSEREAIDLQWFALDQLDRANPGESLQRIRNKLQNH